MTAQMWLQIGLVLLIVFLLSVSVGRYLTDIVMDRRTRLDPVFDPVEESRQGRDRMVSLPVARPPEQPPWLLLLLKILRPRTRSRHSQTRRDAFRTWAHVGGQRSHRYVVCRIWAKNSLRGRTRSTELSKSMLRPAGNIPD
jgi:hypothetical protein